MNPAFLNGATWGAPGAGVEHKETHAAHVFLVGTRAYKIKKPVKLPYLDFSTLEKRRAVIAREFEINRGFTPGVYRGVIEVLGEPVLEMNRFADSDILASQIAKGRADPARAGELADMAAKAHAVAPRREVAGADIMAGLGAQLSGAFTSSPDIFPAAATLEFHALFEEALGRLKPLLNRRSEQGLVRRCHGDLHCGNIALVDGHPVPFDAIEFSEKIATIDVLYDLAFLLMDLQRYGRGDMANAVLNRYLQIRHAEEDLSGLATLPLFLATRAGVRALVTADLVHELAIGQSLKPRGEALDYFRSSIAYLKPPRLMLVCVGGFSGTGKTALAAALAAEIGASPGAVHLRSDVERKIMAGVGETERLPAEAYAPAQSAAVYDVMMDRAELALRAGHSVILDAVFAREAERRSAERLARNTGAAFRGIWLEAPVALLKSRVSERRDDASDADAAIIDRQLGYGLGTIDWDKVDASGDKAAVLAATRQRLRYRHAAPS